MLSWSRSVVLGLAAWLAVVLVGSVLVWTVISRAGDDVSAGGTKLPPDLSTALSPAADAATSPGERRPGRDPRPPAEISACRGACAVVDAEPLAHLGAEPGRDAVADEDAGVPAALEPRGPLTCRNPAEPAVGPDGPPTHVVGRGRGADRRVSRLGDLAGRGQPLGRRLRRRGEGPRPGGARGPLRGAR